MTFEDACAPSSGSLWDRLSSRVVIKPGMGNEEMRNGK